MLKVLQKHTAGRRKARVLRHVDVAAARCPMQSDPAGVGECRGREMIAGGVNQSEYVLDVNG
jgi:hypothetical protein